MRARVIALLPAAALCLMLAGCGDRDSDLEQFVAQVKAEPPQTIEPIPQIKPYRPFSYMAGSRRSPFVPPAVDSAKASHNGLTPNLNRARDPLEQYPLDALHMVGTITSSGAIYALIIAPDHVIHRVHRGEYLGQNNGQVDSISDQGVILTEIVPDGSGGYVKRSAALAP